VPPTTDPCEVDPADPRCHLPPDPSTPLPTICPPIVCPWFASDGEAGGRDFSASPPGPVPGAVRGYEYLDVPEQGAWYLVRARNCSDSSFTNCSGWSQFSNLLFAGPPPPDPAKITVSQSGDLGFVVSWKPVVRVEQYEITYHAEGMDEIRDPIDTMVVGWTAHNFDVYLFDTVHEFKVRSHGNGHRFQSHWGEYSPTKTAVSQAEPEYAAMLDAGVGRCEWRSGVVLRDVGIADLQFDVAETGYSEVDPGNWTGS
jgi:hypothetical protein